MMKIEDMLNDLREGDTYNIDLDVELGKNDVRALNMLAYLYKEILPDDAAYIDAERVLVEALWWHITFNVLTTNYRKSND
jgi:hypothetical protein